MRVTSAVTAGLLVASCRGVSAPVGITPGPSPSHMPSPSPLPSPSPERSNLLSDAGITPISASSPSAAAKVALAKCHVGDDDLIPFKSVTGAGQIASAKDLGHYLPLTGREPQLGESGPAWIVTVHAELPQPGSNEVWRDPTCVVTDGDSGWFATGPITDVQTGKVTEPEAPAEQPDRRIPPLDP
jgi:hypothetical protein